MSSAQDSSEVILEVSNLSIEVARDDGVVRLVDDVSFSVRRHEVFGIVGESGSGKSLTVLAVLGLLPGAVRIAGGQIRLGGRELTTLGFNEMRAIRGKSISAIFQDPMTALNPVRRIGVQIDEAVHVHHHDWARSRVRERSLALMEMVGIPNPAWRYRQFPHEFSGGMRQRIMIAIAMANDPELLIADEPTTALDVTIQAQVLSVLAEVRRRTGAAMVLITHDLGLIAETSDRVAVMYSGRLVEMRSGGSIFAQPTHPYTAGLAASLPSPDRDQAELNAIPGYVPDPARRPAGCAFHPRCAMSAGREACRAEIPALRPIAPDRASACHFAEETTGWAELQREHLLLPDARRKPPSSAPAVLRVDGLVKEFRHRGRFGFGGATMRALRDVSFTLRKGQTLGLVGESGCGKSTLARVVLRLLEASGGRVWVNGEEFSTLGRGALRARRRILQIVFQDPYSSLDPRMTIHEVIAEPLRINGRYTPQRVHELLGHVGLAVEMETRRPDQFSGGQRQRIAIARSLALQPDILILDEAVSALDVSIQAQIINLLRTLQAQMGLAYLFISHDLSVVRHICDEVAVMYLGRLVERGPTRRIFEEPAHPYTQALIAAVPRPDSLGERRHAVIVKGDQPNPFSPPSGCAFRTRCPRATDLCAQSEPALLERTEATHFSACHFATEIAPGALGNGPQLVAAFSSPGESRCAG